MNRLALSDKARNFIRDVRSGTTLDEPGPRQNAQLHRARLLARDERHVNGLADLPPSSNFRFLKRVIHAARGVLGVSADNRRKKSAVF
jgi:hypothetical protein